MGVLSREAGLSRRGFILASLSAAGGLMIGIRPVEAATPDSAGAELGAWIVIDPDESVTLRPRLPAASWSRLSTRYRIWPMRPWSP